MRQKKQTEAKYTPTSLRSQKFIKRNIQPVKHFFLFRNAKKITAIWHLNLKKRTKNNIKCAA